MQEGATSCAGELGAKFTSSRNVARSADADDRQHSLLRRAAPLGQVALENFLGDHADRHRGLPGADFGRYTVQDVRAKSALTICRQPGEPWSLNPYMGCSHACAYCYVPDVAHVERGRWGSYVVVKRNLPRILSAELRRFARKPIFMSSATDPYQPAEADHRITRQCLEIIAHAGWPLRVLTRSPLVRRDIDILSKFDDLEVGMSIPTLDDEARRLIEPSAPPIDGRLRTIRALADAGLRPYVNYAPAFPLSGGLRAKDVARMFHEAGASVVYAFPCRYLPGVAPILRERLEGSVLAALASQMTDVDHGERLVGEINEALAGFGLRAPRREWRALGPPPAANQSHIALGSGPGESSSRELAS
ncbi:MAG: SPL family radical SAM protein [Thermoplasmatota archaeon]